MPKRPSLIQQALQRLDSLEAIGESRHQLKAEQRAQTRAAGKPVQWTHSTGKIHSHATKATYRQHSLDFCRWAKEAHGIRYTADLDTQADRLSTAWLLAQQARGVSPDSQHTMRSALRMFFQDRTIGAGITIPIRHREHIKRSRRPVAMDREFQPRNWQVLIDFLRATGLRRREIRQLTAGRVVVNPSGSSTVMVENGKGGKSRIVPVLPGHEAAVRTAISGKDPTERIFKRIPVRLDIHSLRREYAQALYRHLSGRELPPAIGRLRPGAYDRKAAKEVSEALGHNRVCVALSNYLR